jgi:hypothetical protein
MEKQMTDSSLILIEDEYELIDIEDIYESTGDFNLIDINVEDDHTFCITKNNIISHNCKSMMRVILNKCAQTNTTLVFTNHIYDDPSSLFPSLVKNQSGGKGPLYLASVLIQFGVKQEKTESNDTDKMISIANRVKGITMRALTVKNRFVPPFLETNLYLNFKTGLYKYAGLLEMAIAYGVVIQNGATYTLKNGKKLGFYKSWKDNKDLWEKEIIPPLNKIIEKEFTFSNEALEVNDYNEEVIIAEESTITEDEANAEE